MISDKIIKIKSYNNEELHYHVDTCNYINEDKLFRITGWLFTSKNSEIIFNSETPFTHTRNGRVDVFNAFEGMYKSAETCGFHMEFTGVENDDVLTIQLSTIDNPIGEINVYIKEIDIFKKRLKREKFKRIFSKEYLKATIRALKSVGVINTIKKMINHIHKINNNIEIYEPSAAYSSWIMRNECYDKDEVINEINGFKYKPVISFVVPVYDVDEIWLKKCIDSLLCQYYENFEICIADDCSTKNHIKIMLDDYSKKDKRVKVVYRNENGHISKATNSAIDIATGEFIGLVDNDDEIAPFALYEIVKHLNTDKDVDFIYSDEDKMDTFGNRFTPHFKPDYAPDTLTSVNYICHFSVIRTSIVKELGGMRTGYEGSQDYDLFLRVLDKTKKVYHLPKILYHWRAIEGSTSLEITSKNYAVLAGISAIADHYKRNGVKGEVSIFENVPYYKTIFEVNNELISIIIPTKDHSEDLIKCVNSIYNKSTYKNFEIIIIDNGSIENETFEMFDKYKNSHANFTVLPLDVPFNYALLNNKGAEIAKGEYIVLLNNDTEVITDNWLELMLGYARQSHVGAVGAKLLYVDNTIQHCGVLVGMQGSAGHFYPGSKRDDIGYVSKLVIANNVSAVTGACFMINKEKYFEVNGLDEDFKVAFNDIDFNLKLLDNGYFNVVLPYVELYHYESKSRGYEDTPEKIKRFNGEKNRLNTKWGNKLTFDRFYNINLDINSSDFRIKNDYFK